MRNTCKCLLPISSRARLPRQCDTDRSSWGGGVAFLPSLRRPLLICSGATRLRRPRISCLRRSAAR
eukprot:scaffold74968_cov37-Phaeocystis_antarctica.AAC.1